MAVVRVESLVYGADNVADGIRFYEQWGLEKVEAGAKGAVFRTPENQTVHIRAASDPTLPSAPDGANTMREATWGVDSAASLERLGGELAKDREVTRDADGAIHSRDDTGFAIAFKVVNRTPATQRALEFNINNVGPRVNRVIDRAPARPAKPIRIGHVVYTIPSEGREKAAEFYLDRLGFRLSDRSKNLGDFMRVPGLADHHSLFLLHRANKAGFDHAAFELHDFDEIMVGGKHMKNSGWRAATKPGRHMLGSNLFWYFLNPMGGKTEYFADIDRMDDNWQPQVWEEHPGWAIWEFEPN
jgi:catechol 2,3-dioxygenase-like lactoylglutathione lyase family enzyme